MRSPAASAATRRAGASRPPRGCTTYAADSLRHPSSPAASSAIVISKTTDGGLTWSAPHRISNVFTNDQGSTVVVTKTGTVYVTFETFNGSTDSVAFAVSTDVARTQFGIRLIVGDARGKGLDAVEIAAHVLGVFREVAHEVYTLAEVGPRLDASLARTLDASQAHSSRSHEEFVTAVLAEIDPCAGGLTIYNCGHPPPILL